MSNYFPYYRRVSGSTWIPRTNNNGLDPSNFYYWNTVYNDGAYFYTWYPYEGASGAVWCNTYNLALPNCTTYALGRILEAGDSRPLNAYFPNASNWHSNLANGWVTIPYNPVNVEIGDILEWSTSGNHVAVVENIINDNIYVSESAYTSDNGTAGGDRTDTIWGSTKQSVYNRGVNVYPNRFFHYGMGSIWYSSSPNYILKNPAHHGRSTTGNTRKLFVMLPTKLTSKRRLIYV